MEGKKELSSEMPVKNDGGSDSYRVTSRDENILGQSSGPTMAAPPTSKAAPAMEAMKKKRGRPRKYGPDGTVTVPLSPLPLSVWEHPRGARLPYMVGANFSTLVLTVNTGEDVALKIYSFGQRESRAICVLAASGSVSNVTIRQPNSSGGTITYEGRFEILSLSGSFMPNNDGAMKSRSGGISVALAGPDGRVFGGGLAGILVAASPVQVVIGSFLPCHQQAEQKPREESRIENVSNVAAPPVKREAADFTTPTSFHFNNNNMDPLNPVLDVSESSSPDGDGEYESCG